jgi:hypothetical protein
LLHGAPPGLKEFTIASAILQTVKLIFHDGNPFWTMARAATTLTEGNLKKKERKRWSLCKKL